MIIYNKQRLINAVTASWNIINKAKGRWSGISIKYAPVDKHLPSTLYFALSDISADLKIYRYFYINPLVSNVVGSFIKNLKSGS